MTAADCGPHVHPDPQPLIGPPVCPAGICGGLGEYFNMDPLIIRLIAVALVALTGFFPGVFLYFIAIIFIPMRLHG